MQYISRSFILGLFLFLFISACSIAQQWSDKQKEIWKNVEKYWSFDDAKDLDSFIGYFSDSYKGWSYDAEKPMSKKEVREELRKDYEDAKGKTIKTTLKPLEIWVNGDMAFVDYTYVRNYKSEDGKEETKSGRWTDILQKQGDKWVLVGDHGGEVKK
jgi:ketosteroid isomerase-like protein